MRLPAIEKKARSLGIEKTWRYSKEGLIKMIQQAEGNFDCFKTPRRTYCNEALCCWKSECAG